MTFILCLIVLGSLTTLNSCQKDDNSNYQEKGNYGNANATTVKSPIVWTNINSTSYSVTFNTSIITQDIIDNGTIIVSMSNNNTVWMQLPFNTGSYSLFYWYQPGSLYARVVQITGGSFEPTLLYQYIKVTVIKGV